MKTPCPCQRLTSPPPAAAVSVGGVVGGGSAGLYNGSTKVPRSSKTPKKGPDACMPSKSWQGNLFGYRYPTAAPQFAQNSVSGCGNERLEGEKVPPSEALAKSARFVLSRYGIVTSSHVRLSKEKLDHHVTYTGPGCSDRAGGADGCCSENIQAADVSCDKTGAGPFILQELSGKRGCLSLKTCHATFA